MKTYIIPRKIYYQRKDEKSITPCPFGTSMEHGTKKGSIITYFLTKVGSLACGNCIFNKDTEYYFVKCTRKPIKENK